MKYTITCYWQTKYTLSVVNTVHRMSYIICYVASLVTSYLFDINNWMKTIKRVLNIKTRARSLFKTSFRWPWIHIPTTYISKQLMMVRLSEKSDWLWTSYSLPDSLSRQEWYFTHYLSIVQPKLRCPTKNLTAHFTLT